MKKEIVDSMTLQEAVDYAVKKIVEQGRQCMITEYENGDSIGESCCYMNDKGDHCVVGWLLDEENEQLMNFEVGVGSISRALPDCVPELIHNNLFVFQTLQSFHDCKLKDVRQHQLLHLETYGIDVSGDHFQKWVGMGD